MDLCGNTVAFPALRKDFFLSRSAATAPAAPAPAPSPAALPLPPLPEAAAAQTPLTERTQPVLVEERTETVPPALAEPSATPATVPAAEGRAFTPAGTATQPPTETAAARGHETPLSAAPRGFPLGRASSTFKPVLSPEATPAAPTPAPAATPAAEAAAAAGGATPGALEVFSPGLSTAQPVALRFSPMAPQAQAPAQATPVAPAGPAPLPLPLSPVDCGDPSDAGEGEAEESASAPAPPPLPAPPAPPAAEVTEAAPFAGFQFQSLSPVVELAEGTSAEPSPLNFQKPAEAAAAHVEAAPFPVPAAASPAPAALGSAAAAVTPAAAAVAASDFVFDSQLKGTMHGTAEAASSVSPEAFFAMRFDAASARSAQIALTPAAAAASPAAPAAEPAAAPSPCPSADGNADILAELWGASSSSFGAAASPLPQVATSPQQPSPAQADAADGVSAAAGPGHWQPSPSEGPAPPPESGADLQPCSSDAPAAPDVHTDSEVELGQGPSGGSGSGGGFVEAPYGESSYRVMNGFEPTVTVNMREAMSDIYSMFQARTHGQRTQGQTAERHSERASQMRPRLSGSSAARRQYGSCALSAACFSAPWQLLLGIRTSLSSPSLPSLTTGHLGPSIPSRMTSQLRPRSRASAHPPAVSPPLSAEQSPPAPPVPLGRTRTGGLSQRPPLRYSRRRMGRR